MHMFIGALCKHEVLDIDVTTSTGGFTISLSTIDIQQVKLDVPKHFSIVCCNA